MSTAPSAVIAPSVVNPLNPILLKDYVKQQNIKAMSMTVLRSKENQYPFIIVRNEEGAEESLFFSKALSEEYAGKEVIETKELGSCFVVTVTYTDGRASRHKLSRSGNMASIEDFDWG